MTRALRDRTPVFETAEPRMLLSSAVAALRTPGPIRLQGEVSLLASATVGSDLQGVGNLSGSGRVAPLGLVHVTSQPAPGSERSASVDPQGQPTASVTLSNARGRIILTTLSSFDAGAPHPIPFVVTGGTGAYRNASGHGTLTLAGMGRPSLQIHGHALSVTLPVSLRFSG